MRKFGWKLIDLGFIGVGLVITSLGWEALKSDCASKKQKVKTE